MAQRPSANGGKAKPVEPVSAGLYVLAAVSHLQANPDEAATEKAKEDLVNALNSRTCSSTVMPSSFCGWLLNLGKEWLGWMALQRGEIDEAAVQLAGANESGWSQWAQGKRAFRDKVYGEAMSQYPTGNRDLGAGAAHGATHAWLHAFVRVPELSKAYADLGGAELLAEIRAAAIASLNQSAKEDPSDARSLYLRARAKELSGQMEGALADYNLASRNAFAAAKELASGEAHLYRGILLFRRKDFPRAEDEFGSALNSRSPQPQGGCRGVASSGGRCGRILRFVAAVAGARAGNRHTIFPEGRGPHARDILPDDRCRTGARRFRKVNARRCDTVRIRWHPEALIKSYLSATWARMRRPSSRPTAMRVRPSRSRPAGIGKTSRPASGKKRPTGTTS